MDGRWDVGRMDGFMGFGEGIWGVWFVVFLAEGFAMSPSSPLPIKILLHVSFVSTMLFDTLEMFSMVFLLNERSKYEKYSLHLVL